MTVAYERSPDAITARSFAIIRAEAELSALPAALEPVAVRLIHASGMTDLVADIAASPGAAEAGRAALGRGAAVLVDAAAVAAGINRAALPARNPVICTLDDPRAVALARDTGTTRAATAVELWGDFAGALVAIGVAPTALFRLLELVAAGAPPPALIIGMPVGFVGAAESKEALIASGLPHIVVRGRRGGSAMAAAAVNALARP